MEEAKLTPKEKHRAAGEEVKKVKRRYFKMRNYGDTREIHLQTKWSHYIHKGHNQSEKRILISIFCHVIFLHLIKQGKLPVKT